MKVQVLIDDEVVSRIDKQAKRKGLSRSAYCAQAILSDMLHDEAQEVALARLGSKVENLDKMFGATKK